MTMINKLYNKSKLAYNGLWILITVIIVLLDQITKFAVVKNMYLFQKITVIDGFFDLYYVRNDGAGLGLFSNARWLFMSFTTIVIIFTVILLIKNYFSNGMAFLSIVFILSGGIGNMIDRVLFGEVVDFFQFQIKYFDFIFNIADVFITFGTIMFAVYYIYFHDKNKGKVNDRAV